MVKSEKLSLSLSGITYYHMVSLISALTFYMKSLGKSSQMSPVFFFFFFCSNICFNPMEERIAKTPLFFGHFECSRVNAFELIADEELYSAKSPRTSDIPFKKNWENKQLQLPVVPIFQVLKLLWCSVTATSLVSQGPFIRSWAFLVILHETLVKVRKIMYHLVNHIFPLIKWGFPGCSGCGLHNVILF